MFEVEAVFSGFMAVDKNRLDFADKEHLINGYFAFKTRKCKICQKLKFRARVCATMSSSYDLFAGVGFDLW